MKKDTIYIDSDDEIAADDDKVVASKAKVVALVLPKRFTMLHSAVNMKILKKSAAQSKKNLVLITTEQALLPIAAASGMYVAKSLQSKPAVPEVFATEDSATEDAAVLAEQEEPTLDPETSIGELAHTADDTIDLDNTAPATKEAEKPSPVPSNKQKKDKKLVVPNFDRFRKKLIFVVVGGVALVIFLIFALFVWPRATVTITAQQQEIPLAIAVTASPTQSDDAAAKTFKLQTKTVDKADTKTTDATGKKDMGQKATGTVEFYNCSKEDKLADTVRTVPAGTGISTGNLTYITQQAVQVPPSGFNGNTCKFDKPSSSVGIVAQNAGAEYNVNGKSFSVAGFGTMTAKDDGGLSGGSSKVVTVVAQEDCDKLQNELNNASNSEQTKKQLMTEFSSSGLTPIADTYKVQTVSATCEPNVGQEATRVTAKATYRYTMSGISTEALTQLVTQSALEKAGQGQTVADTGLVSAVISIDTASSALTTMTVKTTARTGVKQDADALKAQIAGKNARQTSETLKNIPGVKEVNVDYSPFWVRSTPKNQDHITIIFKSDESAN